MSTALALLIDHFFFAFLRRLGAFFAGAAASGIAAFAFFALRFLRRFFGAGAAAATAAVLVLRPPRLAFAFFCFFYAAVQFNSEETAENLKRHGGFIPGIRPGKATELYFDTLFSRITVLGAAYLVLICLVPEVLFSQAGVPFYLGGTSLLIVVNVTMDTVSQIQSHLIAHQYGDLIKKAKLKTSRKR